MAAEKKEIISVEVEIAAPIATVWKCWTTPADIIHWNNASPDWHTPRAENDLRPGGQFSYRMEARDGSMGFDFWGIYDKVVDMAQIDYTLGDGRKVGVSFSLESGKIRMVESFEAEGENPLELQRSGWQAILNNFKRYVETSLR
jgi:uncharacterized protein YndB with AHSA1/START domain